MHLHGPFKTQSELCLLKKDTKKIALQFDFVNFGSEFFVRNT